MGKLDVLKIIVIVCVGTAYSLTEDVACCATGQLIRSKHHLHCWDPWTEKKSNLSLSCNDPELLIPNRHYNFTVNDDGRLLMLMKNWEQSYEVGTFCVAQILSKKHNKPVRSAAVCFKKMDMYITEDIYGYCMIVSAVFLLLTAVYYACYAELRDLQGTSIINFCCSLALGFSILSAMKLVPYSNMNLCATRGFLAYFFIIASFFWMNAISIQTLFKIRRESPTDSNQKKEFLWYALYAWGAPTAITLAMAVVNFIPGDHLKPGIGLNHCWFFDIKQQWWYMYSVTSILLAVNIGIFVYILYRLWNPPINTFEVFTHNFATTLRFFVVTGIPWIFEMISSTTNLNLFWEVLNVINALQGVIIFLVLVLCPRPLPVKESYYDLNISKSTPRGYSKV